MSKAELASSSPPSPSPSAPEMLPAPRSSPIRPGPVLQPGLDPSPSLLHCQRSPVRMKEDQRRGTAENPRTEERTSPPWWVREGWPSLGGTSPTFLKSGGKHHPQSCQTDDWLIKRKPENVLSMVRCHHKQNGSLMICDIFCLPKKNMHLKKLCFWWPKHSFLLRFSWWFTIYFACHKNVHLKMDFIVAKNSLCIAFFLVIYDTFCLS